MKLIKPSCKACRALAKAIDAYIEKADNNLEDEMKKAGYVDAKESVEGASALEEEIGEILREQTEELVEVVEDAGTFKNAKRAVEEYFETDTTSMALSVTFADYFKMNILKLSNDYMKETEGDLAVDQLRKRTTAWITDWSDQLADLMQLTSEQRMGTLLEQAMDSDKGVELFARRLADDGIRQEGYRARRAALTEMLRAHSVARQESIMQSPATDRKKWVHSGGHKNKPRENHVDMDGQIVPKDKPFELTGRDGGTYYPMYPRDPILPAAESINCHCTHVPVSNDDILGLSYEERQQMQLNIIAADNREWEKTLDAKNRRLSGQPLEIDGVKEVSREYIIKSTPNSGEIIRDSDFVEKRHDEEISFADWLHKKLGGTIVHNPDSRTQGKHYADFQWNGKLWELKTLNTTKANTVDKHIQIAYHQIETNKGGAFFDMTSSDLSIEETAKIITDSERKRCPNDTFDVLIRKGDDFAIIRIE